MFQPFSLTMLKWVHRRLRCVNLMSRWRFIDVNWKNLYLYPFIRLCVFIDFISVLKDSIEHMKIAINFWHLINVWKLEHKRWICWTHPSVFLFFFFFFFFFLRVTCLVLLSLYDGMLVWLSSVLNLACKQALYLGHSREVTREPDLKGDASVLSRSLVWSCSQAILNGKFHFFHLRTHFKQMSCLRNARRKYILLQHHIL